MSGYIGSQPVPQATQHREAFTATASQTSFATVGYTPQFIDVYLNGIKLAGEDYTATNGSNIVLTTGAAASDILEYVAYTPFEVANQTFTGTTTTDALTVTGAFTSKGIDDNAAATAMTLDASGSLLVGKTVFDDGATKGFEHYRGGGDSATHITRSNNPPLNLNRINSDGEVLRIRKDGTTVGSIGSASSYLYIGSPAGSGSYLRLGNSNVVPAVSTGSDRDAAVDLGYADSRFKDLYLSGGVYLGGTGAANKLDDYEEGFWSPVLQFGGATVGVIYSIRIASYTKVGNTVVARCIIFLNNKGSSTGSATITGLPFTSSEASTASRYGDRVSAHQVTVATSGTTIALVDRPSGPLNTAADLDDTDFANTTYLNYVVTYST
jgi:hypothetical protein